MYKLSIKEFIEKYKIGEFEKCDHDTQIRAGWFDWFCSIEKLDEKLKNIYQILSEFKNDTIRNNYTAVFANRFSKHHNTTYDKILFVPLGDYKGKYFDILIDCPYSNKKYMLYIDEYDFTRELECENIEKLIEFMNLYL